MKMLRALLCCLAAGALFVACARSRTVQEVAVAPSVEPTPQRMSFEATAYSVKGTTKSGEQTRHGVVAADPRVLPIGTRIRIDGAGAYSGEYTVLDTGREIKGHELDIFMPRSEDAVEFGRKQVQVEVLSEAGSGGRQAER